MQCVTKEKKRKQDSLEGVPRGSGGRGESGPPRDPDVVSTTGPERKGWKDSQGKQRTEDLR